jgi:cardiolipin synthase (CMP-forming)
MDEPSRLTDQGTPPETRDEPVEVVREGWAGVLTVPNLVTLVRLGCVPWFLWLLFEHDDRVGAGALLAVLGATDWVDGWIARRFHQTSTVGKVLDPTADRIMLGVAMVAVLVDGSVPGWVAWLVLVREVLVSVVVLALAALGAARVDVLWVGKTGTFLNMFAFPFFVIGAGVDPGGGHDLLRVLGWACVVPGLAFSWYALWLYVPLARTALREGRSARSRDVSP